MPSTVRDLAELIWNHPANAHHRVRAFAKAGAWQVYKRLIGRPFTMQVYDDLRMRCYADSHQPGRLIYFGGLPDFEEMTFMQRYLRPGDRFIDGGANAGLYTLLAAKLVGATGAVHAFEASPISLRRLRENVELNDLTQVIVHARALSDHAGTTRFTVGRAAGSGDRIAREADVDVPMVEVETVTLDDALPASNYAMCKLDLEGAEALTLRGAAHLLAELNPPVWELELVDHFARRFGSSAAMVADTFREAGYVIGTYSASTNTLEFADAVVGSLPNVLAVAKSRIAEVTARLERSAPHSLVS